jgi:hypothetical protein
VIATYGVAQEGRFAKPVSDWIVRLMDTGCEGRMAARERTEGP